MSYKLLKQVIAHLKQRSRCPYCKGRFDDDAIFPLATSVAMEMNSSVALFLVLCIKCNASALVVVEITNTDSPTLNEESIKMETKGMKEHISINEVLDMHNFLKGWTGDVKELFK